MGLAASKDNDDLTDYMIQERMIGDADTERVLRLVDRGHFIVGVARPEEVYRDNPWKAATGSPGLVHLSAPSIYARVLAHLELRPGLSFLNVGSGSGFLSTAVGFLLGSQGKNHGIELHSNIVEHAEECWHRTVARPEVSAFEIAMPRFVCGNALSLGGLEAKYDRIYIGAGVKEEVLGRFLPMLKTGGILIAPVGQELLRFENTGTTTERELICHVQFAEIVRPRREDGQEIAVEDSVVDSDASEALIRECGPRPLLSLCVDAVRDAVRNKLKGQKDVQMRELVVMREAVQRHFDEIAEEGPRHARGHRDRPGLILGYVNEYIDRDRENRVMEHLRERFLREQEDLAAGRRTEEADEERAEGVDMEGEGDTIGEAILNALNAPARRARMRARSNGNGEGSSRVLPNVVMRRQMARAEREREERLQARREFMMREMEEEERRDAAEARGEEEERMQRERGENQERRQRERDQRREERNARTERMEREMRERREAEEERMEGEREAEVRREGEEGGEEREADEPVSRRLRTRPATTSRVTVDRNNSGEPVAAAPIPGPEEMIRMYEERRMEEAREAIDFQERVLGAADRFARFVHLPFISEAPDGEPQPTDVEIEEEQRLLEEIILDVTTGTAEVEASGDEQAAGSSSSASPGRLGKRERAEDEEDSDDGKQKVKRRRVEPGQQRASLRDFDLEFRRRLWSLDAPVHIRVSLLLGVPYEEPKEEEEEKEEPSASED